MRINIRNTAKVIHPSAGITGVWKSVRKNPSVQFFLIFTIIFAFAVGISSYNFGALSRYRIPCLPFYILALVLIYYEHNPYSKRFFSLALRVTQSIKLNPIIIKKRMVDAHKVFDVKNIPALLSTQS